MASRFIRIEIIHAGDGSSATGLSAYITRQRRLGVSGQCFDFTDRRDELLDHGTIIPPSAPEWALSPDKIWREAERSERTIDRKTREQRWKKNAQVAKHFVIALPRHFNDHQRRELLLQFIRAEIRPQEHNAAVEWAIHRDEANPHAHLILSTRSLGPDGFGKKARGMNPQFGRAKTPRNDADWDIVWAEFQKLFIKKRYGPVAARIVRDRARHRRERFNRNDPQRVQKVYAFAEAEKIIQTAKRLNPLFALQELTKHRRSFVSDDVYRYCQSLELPHNEATAFVRMVLSHAKCIELFDASGQPVGWTHADRRAMEVALLQRSTMWAKSSAPTMEAEIAAARAIGLSLTFKADQAKTLDACVGKRLALLSQNGRTERLAMLSALRDTLAPGGLTVLAVALSSIGAAHLRKCGFRAAQTIQSALSRRKRGTAAWDGRTVIIADEAEHIDTKLMYRLFEAVQKSGARLILSGAKLQTGSIEAGEGIFAELVSQYDCPDQKTANQQPPKSQVALNKNLDAGDIEKAIRAYHAARQIVAPITASHDRLNPENGQPSVKSRLSLRPSGPSYG